MNRRTWGLTGAAVAVVAVVIGLVVLSGADHTAAAAAEPASTAKVVEGRLSAAVSQEGTLTYGARPDVINQARGVYTQLPRPGAKAGCGRVLYRVDERPVLLLCGPVPAYRALHAGDAGRDVRQLNRNLHALGFDAGAGRDFTGKTTKALAALQRRRGARVTGTLALGDAVFEPGPVRIARVSGRPGGSARPGARVLKVTSDTLRVRVDLDPSQQGQVKTGDRAQITLPGNSAVMGRVAGFGPIAKTIPTSISLDHPGRARGLDRAPVQVQITTRGVASALSVPVTALVGRSGGGFAVEAVRAGGRQLVAVRVGLFDDVHGRVQVEGGLRAGERVAVPSL